MGLKTVQDLKADKLSLQRNIVDMLRIFEREYGWGLVDSIEVIREPRGMGRVSERVHDVKITIKI